MFSSKPKDTAPLPAPVTPTAAPVSGGKRARSLSAPSIISADMVINGTLISTGDIQIDGRVEGDVRSAGLVIGDKAEIHGEILRRGRHRPRQGGRRIRAKKVLLASTSHVEGDILHEAFAVESGAFFEGNCRHSDNPLGEGVQTVAASDYESGKAGQGDVRHTQPPSRAEAHFLLHKRTKRRKAVKRP